jgi:hypothetical protein
MWEISSMIDCIPSLSRITYWGSPRSDTKRYASARVYVSVKPTLKAGLLA